MLRLTQKRPKNVSKFDLYLSDSCLVEKVEEGRLLNGFLPRLPNECLKGKTAAKWSVCVLREHDGTALLYGFDTEMTPCCNDKEGLCDTESNSNRTRLPDDKSQIFRLYAFGPSGLMDYGSATLRCKI